ncbi:hypothetical protein SAMN05428978_102519 [Nitrosomonas sp. Nm34]|nr:hypothetical protein SAMN05428978_102519 [Nitrosomonas sp. Nm34]
MINLELSCNSVNRAIVFGISPKHLIFLLDSAQYLLLNSLIASNGKSELSKKSEISL